MRFGAVFVLAAAAAGCTFPEYELAPALQASSCGNGLLDGAEQSVDCGPDCTTACQPSPSDCATDQDCPDGVCESGDCSASPSTTPMASCDNGARDQTESDIDCGGRDGCAPCATGERCESGYDCNMAKCNAGFCLAQSCADGIQNQDETDVDCGGDACGPCATKQHCSVTTDCERSRCLQGTCQPQGCDDGVKNGDESGQDCGGSCAPCPDFGGCASSADCTSLSCNTFARLCLAATCQDGIKNGSEASTDCGSGAACDRCPLASSCSADGDCLSGTCNEQRCVPAGATGAALSTSGWVATASATFSETTQPGAALDGDAGSHWTSGVSQVPGMWFMVDMRQPQAFFALELLCTSNGDYARTLRVLASEDGSSFAVLMGNTSGQKTLRFEYAGGHTARYLKVELLQDTGGTWWRIDELRVLQ